MADKPYIVVDANIWIDFMLQDATAGHVIDIIEKAYIPIQSNQTMQEIETVTGQARFSKVLSAENRTDLLSYIKALSDFRVQTHYPTISKDPDDNMYLGLAIQTGAENLISKDKHLRELKHYRGIQIWSPEQFIARERTLEREPGETSDG